MIRRLVAVALVGGIGLVADPADAVTRKQAAREITNVRHELVVIQEYAEGKRFRLARTTCEGLRDHARALVLSEKPRTVKSTLWAAIQAAAVEYEQAGAACVELRLPEFVIHLVQGGDAVRAVRKINLRWGRMFGDGAIKAGYPPPTTTRPA